MNDKAKDGTINIQQLFIEIQHISKSSELLDAIIKKACQHHGSFKLQRRTTREPWGTNAPPALKPIFQSGWKTLASQNLVAICHYTGSLSIKRFLFSGLEMWLTVVEIVVHVSPRPHHSSSFLLSCYQASVRPWLSGGYNERPVDLGGTSKQWLFGPGVPHG